MLTKKFIETALAIRREAPFGFWESLCQGLSSSPVFETKSKVLLKLPSSFNSDLVFLINSLLAEQEKGLTWREIGLCLQSIGDTNDRVTNEGTSEIIWSGPPTETIPVRRIDQVLYDLIQEAQRHILLVTFAAARISFLSKSLVEANQRAGVSVDLILESESESEGQLAVDARAAFPEGVTKAAHIYYWPLIKRERNEAGRPGKLHAKCAVIDDSAIISSANLTDDAFNRNMELGVLFRGGAVPKQILGHFKSLISSGILSNAI